MDDPRTDDEMSTWYSRRPNRYTGSDGRLRCSKCHDRVGRCVCGTGLEHVPHSAGFARRLTDQGWVGAVTGRPGSNW